MCKKLFDNILINAKGCPDTMKERLLVIGDIHGEYNMLCEVLKKSSYSPERDRLVLLGDYIDRGPNSKKVVKTVKQLVAEGAIALKGNHEEMAIQFFRSKNITKRSIYLQNGGENTIRSYSNLKEFKKDVRWFKKLPCIKIIKGEYIFTHAGLKPKIAPDKQQKRDLLWIREEFISYDWSKRDFPETIVAGHTPVPDVQKHPGVLMVDTGAGKGGLVSLVDLTNDEIYQATF